MATPVANIVYSSESILLPPSTTPAPPPPPPPDCPKTSISFVKTTGSGFDFISISPNNHGLFVADFGGYDVIQGFSAGDFFFTVPNTALSPVYVSLYLGGGDNDFYSAAPYPSHGFYFGSSTPIVYMSLATEEPGQYGTLEIESANCGCSSDVSWLRISTTFFDGKDTEIGVVKDPLNYFNYSTYDNTIDISNLDGNYKFRWVPGFVENVTNGPTSGITLTVDGGAPMHFPDAFSDLIMSIHNNATLRIEGDTGYDGYGYGTYGDLVFCKID